MKKTLYIPIFYFVCAVIFEIFTFLMLGIGAVPKYIFFDITVILIISCFLIFITNNLAQFIICSIFLFVQAGMAYINFLLYIQFGDILSLEMLQLISAANDAMSNDFINIWILVAVLAVFAVFFIIGLWIYKHSKKIRTKKSRQYASVFIMLILMLQLGGVFGYLYNRKLVSLQVDIASESYIESDRFVIDSPILKVKAYKALGTFGFYVNNFYTSFLSGKSADEKLNEIVIDYLSTDTAPLKSEYFGVAEDENVIVIMVESLDSFAISSELTPNIYNFLGDAGYQRNYFSKNKTNISENTSLLGSNPVVLNIQTFAGSNNTDKDSFGFSLPNILAAKGYSTNYFHSFKKEFYNRDYYIPNLGFQNAYFSNDVYSGEYNFFEWKSEEDFVNAMLDKMIPDEKFFTFYTTVGMHGSYATSSKNQDQTKYASLVENSEYFAALKSARQGLGGEMYNYIKNYLASTVGFDRAFGILVDELKAKNIYDDTTIVMFGDHNCYYHNVAFAVKDVVISEFYNFDLNVVPFIIKSKNIDTEKVNAMESMSFSADITPTVLDLLGIDYNRKLYLGSSIFNFTDGYTQRLTFSHTGGIFSDKYYSFDLEEYGKLNEAATQQELNDFKSKANELLRNVYYLNNLYKNYLYKDI